jgi:hypothetical protein
VLRTGVLGKHEYVDHFGNMRASDERIEVCFLLCTSHQGSWEGSWAHTLSLSQVHTHMYTRMMQNPRDVIGVLILEFLMMVTHTWTLSLSLSLSLALSLSVCLSVCLMHTYI